MNLIDQQNRLMHLLTNFAHLLPWIGLAMLLTYVLWHALKLALKITRYKRAAEEQSVYIELTPPAFDDKLPDATAQLFTALHGVLSDRKSLISDSSSVALEIVSTRAEGIRFLVRVEKAKAKAVEQTIHAYLPAVKLKRVKGYIGTGNAKVTAYKQTSHYAYPLKTYDRLASHDPIGYVTGAMTKLKDSELMAVQLVIKPIVLPEAKRLNQRLLANEDIRMHLHNNRASLIRRIFYLVNKLIFGVMGMISEMLHGSAKQANQLGQYELYYKKQVSLNLRPARSLSVFEQELAADMHDKLSQPLFETSIRSLVMTSKAAKQRQKSLSSALGLFSTTDYQSVKPRKRLLQRLSAFTFSRRLVDFTKNNILSAGELASMYHFPNSSSAKTENVVKSLSKTLPAPVSLKNGQNLDVLLGENRHQGSVTPIGLTAAERERHVYIIGGTGNGKTTMLMYSIVQDIEAGKGVAIIDPHGDLSDAILGYITPERVNDVVYLNPDDLSRPIGLNLLEMPEGLEGDELLREKDLVTESAISVLRKIFSEDDSGGHRIEYVLRNTIQTALTLENPTLFTIFRLLNDTKYRQSVVRGLEDKDLVNFWKNEIAKAGEMQKVKMSAGITAKVGRFLFSASAKRVLEQEKSTINFEDILDKQKILICNFSKGLIGEDTSTLFGTTVLAKLQVAALRRARYKQSERSSFFLYVDEFQNFATMSFVEMLSEARKYKLFLIMAEQSTQQQRYQQLVEIILSNVGTVICFRSGSPADERLVLPLFKPYVNEGEIANLPAYNFYMRIAAVEAREPLSGVTVLIGREPDVRTANKVIKASRLRYGKRVDSKKAKKKPIERVEEKKPPQEPVARPGATNKLATVEK